MSKAIQRRRGTTAQHAAFTGLAGEITYDTDKKTLVAHDGATAGGTPLARAGNVADVPVATTTQEKALASSTVLSTPAGAAAVIADHGGWPGNKNGVINGGMQVAQKGTAPSLTTSYVVGKVDMFAAKATGTVGAGTISQADDSTFKGGQSLHLSRVTLTGGSDSLSIATRIASYDAVRFRNKTASFKCRIYHDIGSAKNATVYINKPTASDNFASVTNIATSSAQSCSSGAYSDVKLEGVSMGDCSYGIEIVVVLETGAITTKNIYSSEWQIEEGTVCTAFELRPKAYEANLCDVHCQSYSYANGYDAFPVGYANGSEAIDFPMKLRRKMRTAPTFVGGTASYWQMPVGGAAATAVASITLNAGDVSIRVTRTGAGLTDHHAYYCASQDGKRICEFYAGLF